MEYFAWFTIAAVVVSFVLGTIFDVNIGFMCIITGFFASVLAGGDGTEIIGAMNPSFLVLLIGVTFMFTIANKNKTIEKISYALLKLVKGKRYLMPFAFALLGGTICGIGAGGAQTSTLLSGPTAGMAKKAKIDPLLMSTTTMHGIFAGQFSPVSALAIPIIAFLASKGYGSLAGPLFFWNMVLELVVMVLVFVLFGGLKLFKSRDTYSLDVEAGIEDAKFEPVNWVTLISILLILVNILVLKLNTGIVALLLGFLLLVIDRKNRIKESEVIRSMPWGIIIQVIGAMALFQVMGDAGGTALIVGGIQSLNIGSLGILLLFVAAGLVSFYALSLPVVLVLLPIGMELCVSMGMEALIPGLAIGMCVSGTMVDISPLSINGALFTSAVAGLADSDTEGKRMFRRLFYYGLIMIPASSILSYLLFVVLRVV